MMGRLIDTDRLKEVFSRNVAGGNAYFDLIDNAPTVEAIPKAEYEVRLKADIIAMLEELQTEIEEEAWNQGCIPNYEREDEAYRIRNLIKQKIDKLKRVEDGNDD